MRRIRTETRMFAAHCFSHGAGSKRSDEAMRTRSGFGTNAVYNLTNAVYNLTNAVYNLIVLEL